MDFQARVNLERICKALRRRSWFWHYNGFNIRTFLLFKKCGKVV